MNVFRLAMPILAIVIVASGCKTEPVSPPPDEKKETWVLTFSDEFDGASIDTTKWFVRQHWPFMNDELGYYMRDEVWQSDGVLHIRSRARQMPWPWGGDPVDYTTGWIQTRHSQRYGRFEIRARMPKGQGVHSAHWLHAADSSWPPEIDIVEVLGHQPTWGQMHNHWRDTAGAVKGVGRFFVAPDLSADFHTYAVEWEEGVVRWYFDGVLKFTSDSFISDKPMFLIISTAVGGSWPGSPDSTTVWPQYHDIDWVKFYRRAG